MEEGSYAGSGGREHLRGIVIEHERLAGEQERRHFPHVRVSELRDFGTVNRVVRPDRHDPGRMDGRQRGGDIVAPGCHQKGNRHDCQNVTTVATFDCWSRAKRPGSCRQHDSGPREKYLRSERSSRHAADQESEARREAAEQDCHHVVRRVRVADRPCDDHRYQRRRQWCRRRTARQAQQRRELPRRLSALHRRMLPAEIRPALPALSFAVCLRAFVGSSEHLLEDLPGFGDSLMDDTHNGIRDVAGLPGRGA